MVIDSDKYAFVACVSNLLFYFASLNIPYKNPALPSSDHVFVVRTIATGVLLMGVVVVLVFKGFHYLVLFPRVN